MIQYGSVITLDDAPQYKQLACLSGMLDSPISSELPGNFIRQFLCQTFYETHSSWSTADLEFQASTDPSRNLIQSVPRTNFIGIVLVNQYLGINN